MKRGDLINGYRVLQDFTTAGGGMSKWTFAQKGGQVYFLKEFLAPTYPVEGSPGSARTKEAKRRRCVQFERRHQRLRSALAGKSGPGGNLIVTVDFFRHGPRYYKVTARIEGPTLPLEAVARLPLERRLLILKTATHSLRILHAVGIVHGDLKPENLLIKATLTGHYTTKLIDFDNSYFSGEPPLMEEEFVGDPVYYAPEVGRYVQESDSAEPHELTLAADIFSLGLIFCQYLTGALPTFAADEYKYAYAAVADGRALTLGDGRVPPGLAALISQMLQRSPAARPSIVEVFATLKRPDILSERAGSDEGVVPTTRPSPAVLKPARLRSTLSGTTGHALRGTLLSVHPSAPEAPESGSTGNKGELRGTLLKGSTKKR